MAAWFGRKNEVTPSINSLRFETTGWKYHGELQPGQSRVWETPENDSVSLYFFGIPPDLAVGGLEAIGASYAVGLAKAGAKVIECEIQQFARCDAVRLLFKVPQKPSGLTYQAAVTVPFRDFSFVVKVQCCERGVTGMREAVLVEKRLKAGEKPNVGRPGELFPGWNPDAAEHDSAFPAHPLSRLRRILKAIQYSAVIDDQVRRLPKFPLPSGSA